MKPMGTGAGIKYELITLTADAGATPPPGGGTPPPGGGEPIAVGGPPAPPPPLVQEPYRYKSGDGVFDSLSAEQLTRDALDASRGRSTCGSCTTNTRCRRCRRRATTTTAATARAMSARASPAAPISYLRTAFIYASKAFAGGACPTVVGLIPKSSSILFDFFLFFFRFFCE